MNSLELTGRARTHVVDLADPVCVLHRAAVGPFLAMRAQAALAGHDLVPVSSFRDFAHQARIWNEKFRGERPMFDREHKALDAGAMTDAQRVTSILWWSALPGASRHHWGTEIDVIDRAALPVGYRPQLMPAEYQPGGVFAALSDWLEAHMHGFGFYRPYRSDRGGVQPEPWHLSYAPVSVRATLAVTADVLGAALEAESVLGSDVARARIEEIHSRYVRNVDEPPSACGLEAR
jgi:LAS superfamily LD-carboxypeptidase LdcB